VANYIREIRSKVGHMPIFLNAVAGAVVNEQGQLLLQKRTDAGNWSLPGGMMEYGETFVETLQREMKEDAGLLVEPVKALHTFDQGFTTYPNGDQAKSSAVFISSNQSAAVWLKRILKKRWPCNTLTLINCRHCLINSRAT
jgi:ADP-ribose pyrophosphatase YjhB (NUDIX family)